MNMRRQLQDKIERAKETLNNEKNKKVQLSSKRKAVDDSVKKLISEN